MNSINSNPLLPGFNPALGTLDSVELILTFVMTSSTNADNQTFMIDPLVGLIPTPAQVNATAAGTVLLNAEGFPVFNAGPTAQVTTLLAPFQDAQIQTVITGTASPSVPQPFVDSFVTAGFAPVSFALIQNLTINAFGLGSDGGEVILGPTISNFSGTLEALYNYTPEIGTPEPSSMAAVLACITILWVVRARHG